MCSNPCLLKKIVCIHPQYDRQPFSFYSSMHFWCGYSFLYPAVHICTAGLSVQICPYYNVIKKCLICILLAINCHQNLSLLLVLKICTSPKMPSIQYLVSYGSSTRSITAARSPMSCSQIGRCVVTPTTDWFIHVCSSLASVRLDRKCSADQNASNCSAVLLHMQQSESACSVLAQDMCYLELQLFIKLR